MTSDETPPAPADVDDGDAGDPGTQSLRRARRALVKGLLYVPPAIIGTLLISSDAQAQTTPSCTPNLCEPNQVCGPGVPPCGPYRCSPFENCGPFGCGPYCGPGSCGPSEPCGPGH